MVIVPARFPGSVRIRSKQDFNALRQPDGHMRGRFFLLKYRRNSLHDTARLGMAVSRKVSPLAVERNYIKRQIRESFRHHRAELPALDCLIIALRSARQQTHASLQQDLSRLFGRIGS